MAEKLPEMLLLAEPGTPTEFPTWPLGKHPVSRCNESRIFHIGDSCWGGSGFVVKLDVDLIRACVCARKGGDEGMLIGASFCGAGSNGDAEDTEVDDGSEADSVEGPDEDVLFLKTRFADDDDDDVDDFRVVFVLCVMSQEALSGLGVLFVLLDEAIVCIEHCVVLALTSSL